MLSRALGSWWISCCWVMSVKLGHICLDRKGRRKQRVVIEKFGFFKCLAEVSDLKISEVMCAPVGRENWHSSEKRPSNKSK